MDDSPENRREESISPENTYKDFGYDWNRESDFWIARVATSALNTAPLNLPLPTTLSVILIATY